MFVRVATVGALLLALLVPAIGATDVWLFYGWGWTGWSSGIDQIARRARTLRGVNHVTVLPYYSTQIAYDQALSASSHDPHLSLVFGGYSCGGNSSISVGGSLATHNNRTVHVIALQPSVWCGRYPATHNMYLQDTWSSSTLGLGVYQPDPGPTHHTTFIERREPHGDADTDPLYQRDALYAIAAVADPARRAALQRHLTRTAPYVDRQDANAIWRRE